MPRRTPPIVPQHPLTSVLLRAGSDEDRGEGSEVFDERSSPSGSRMSYGRGGQLVGQRFDLFLGLPAGGGEPAVGADEVAGPHPVHDRRQLGPGQSGRPGRSPPPACPLRAGVPSTCASVPPIPAVTSAATWPSHAVLTEQVGPVPEPRHRFCRHGQRAGPRRRGPVSLRQGGGSPPWRRGRRHRPTPREAARGRRGSRRARSTEP